MRAARLKHYSLDQNCRRLNISVSFLILVIVDQQELLLLFACLVSFLKVNNLVYVRFQTFEFNLRQLKRIHEIDEIKFSNESVFTILQLCSATATLEHTESH